MACTPFPYVSLSYVGMYIKESIFHVLKFKDHRGGSWVCDGAG